MKERYEVLKQMDEQPIEVQPLPEVRVDREFH